MVLLRKAIIHKLEHDFKVHQIGGRPLSEVSTTELHDLLGRLELERQTGRSA
ncbi:hypothetical protein NDK47_17890 [Brevibacillus ruminantium]|uniref:Fur-regulated basic protein FbpA n=1 Tax=Brevibacillus ruminantium TaxID=2950604 RepID=A0ABY4WDK8_9BACL|nr:hypothetical protein [Brevibacillus ruminantium]USG64022.1 hypothetical protein NDK47_17890 [Brevibacillus ruminantium]